MSSHVLEAHGEFIESIAGKHEVRLGEARGLDVLDLWNASISKIERAGGIVTFNVHA